MVKAHLLCALLPLCACTIYTLPDLDTAGSSTGTSTDPSATTGDDPTTGSGVEAIEIDEAGPVKVPVGEIVTIGATVLDADGLPVPAAAIAWTSSAELTLFADSTGALLGISPGTAQLTASVGGVASEPVTVEVVANVPPAATFAAVRTVTTARCALPGCHVDGVEPGDLRFDRDADDLWEELLEDAAQVAGLPRVTPGDPSESYLLHKLVQRSPAAGAQMPIGATPIDAASAQVILRWILAGASAQ